MSRASKRTNKTPTIHTSDAIIKFGGKEFAASLDMKLAGLDVSTDSSLP